MPHSALHSDFHHSETSTKTYSITDLCEEFGVTARALRFYEDEGLIGRAARMGASIASSGSITVGRQLSRLATRAPRSGSIGDR